MDAIVEELVTKDSTQSSACCQAMEEMARRRMQQWLQGLLEDEVTQFLGRAPDTTAATKVNTDTATATASRGD